MGDVAASGGYYIAAPADTIVAEPGTHHRLDRRRDRQVRAEGHAREARHRRGRRERRADGGDRTRRSGRSPRRSARASKSRCSRPTTCFSRASRQAARRPPEKIDAVGQGRVWTGRQARELNLVDELGGLDDGAPDREAARQARPDAGSRSWSSTRRSDRSSTCSSNPFGATTEAALVAAAAPSGSPRRSRPLASRAGPVSARRDADVDAERVLELRTDCKVDAPSAGRIEVARRRLSKSQSTSRHALEVNSQRAPSTPVSQ